MAAKKSLRVELTKEKRTWPSKKGTPWVFRQRKKGLLELLRKRGCGGKKGRTSAEPKEKKVPFIAAWQKNILKWLGQKRKKDGTRPKKVCCNRPAGQETGLEP